MNNFYITISNGLLTDGHRKRIGSAVWEFMWLIDRITRIDAKGEGWVLGGKPINLKDLTDGVDEATVSRNLEKLEAEGYIRKIRTPYGISVRVLKAKKRFGKNATRSDKNVESIGSDKNVESNIRHNSIDNTKDIISDVPSPEKELNKQIGEIIDLFGLFNRNHKAWYNNTTQRKDIRWLIETYTPEKVKKAIYLTKFCFDDRYYPSIGTPHELREKWVKMKKFYRDKEIKDKRFVQDFEKYMIDLERKEDQGKEKVVLTQTIAGRKISIMLNKLDAPSNS